MSHNWLDELRQLHEENKTQHQVVVEQLNLSVLSSQRKQQAADLLRQTDAYNLLRQVQKALLNGKGVVNVFEETKRYDRTISLAWQGPISAARKPDPKSSETYQYITIGARQGKLFVNHQEITPATPETLKIALVEAAKKPGRS